MEARPPAEIASDWRLRPLAERLALWKSVQRIWRKRATDATDVIAQMRAEWDRESPASKRHEAVSIPGTHAMIGLRFP